jgi:hypothetical protein
VERLIRQVKIIQDWQSAKGCQSFMIPIILSSIDHHGGDTIKLKNSLILLACFFLYNVNIGTKCATFHLCMGGPDMAHIHYISPQ